MTPVPALALILAFAALILALLISAVRLFSRPGLDLASAPEALRDPLRNADRHSRWTRSAAVLVASAAAAITHLMGAPATLGVFGLAGLAVLVLGERRSPVITKTRRTAALTPRRIRDCLPRRSAALIPLGLAAILGLFALGIPTASPVAHIDPQWPGAVHLPAGSYLEGVSTTPAGDLIRSVFYPWPGAFYIIPVLVPLAAQLVLAAAGLWAVAAREQVSASSDEHLDVVLRRRSAEGIVGFLLVSLALLMPRFGTSMIEAATWKVEQWDYLRGALGGLAVIVALTCMATGVLLLIRRPSVFSSPRPSAADTTPSEGPA